MSLTEKSSFGFVSSCVSTKQLLFVGTEQCIYTRFFFGPFSSRLTSFGQIFFLINFRFVIYLSNNIIIRMISYKPNEKKNMSFRNSRSLTVDPFLVDFFRTNLWHSTYLHLIFWTMYANYSMRFFIIYFLWDLPISICISLNVRLFGRNLDRSIVMNFLEKTLMIQKKVISHNIEKENCVDLGKTMTFEENYDIWRPKV